MCFWKSYKGRLSSDLPLRPRAGLRRGGNWRPRLKDSAQRTGRSGKARGSRDQAALPSGFGFVGFGK